MYRPARPRRCSRQPAQGARPGGRPPKATPNAARAGAAGGRRRRPGERGEGRQGGPGDGESRLSGEHGDAAAERADAAVGSTAGRPRRIREARDRRSALRRRHQRRRGAARALHRRAAARHADVEVVTTCARDYVTWRNELPGGRRAGQRRGGAAVSGARTSGMPRDFGRRSDRVFDAPALARRRARLARERRPGQPRDDRLPGDGAVRLRHPLQLPLLPRLARRPRGRTRKALLVPTAERDPAVGAGHLRADLPRRPRGHVQLAGRARDDPGRHRQRRPSPASSSASGRMCRSAPIRRASAASSRSTGRSRSTSAASTRTRAARSCSTTSSATRRSFPRGLDLVLVGSAVMPVPKHPRIHHLGFLSDEDKFDALAAVGPADHAVVLREPVDGGARSLGARAAGARQRPLRRAQGPVHPQQRRPLLRAATRSSPRRSTRWSRTVRCTPGSGQNGREYFRRHYAWPVIERKYLDMLAAAAEAPPAPRAALEPLPGWFARRKATIRRRARRCWQASRPGPWRRQPRRRVTARRRRAAPRVHQVLATLGYGDAIGHEVLGIQRALRARRLRVGHLRRDRRSAARGPDARLSGPGRRGDAGRRPDPSLLDRLARLAHRLRAAGPHGARLPQHHAARILHRRAQGSGEALLPRPPRAHRLHRALRSRARRFGVQPAGARGARLPRHRRPAGGPRLHAPRRPSRPRPGRRVRRRLDQRDVRRPGDPEQEVRGRDPRVPRLPDAPQSARAPAAGRARTAGSSATSRCCTRWSPGSARPTCTSSATCRTRS